MRVKPACQFPLPRHVILAILLLTGCTPAPDRDTLTLAYAADIRGFDPALATDIRTGRTISLVYDNLVRFQRDRELIPGLATSWVVDQGGRRHTFRLRSGVCFHDGSPLRARDVVYSIQRVLDPATSSPQTWLFDRIVGAEEYMAGETDRVSGLVAVDDSTLIIRIEAPFAPFIQYLAMPSAAVVNRNQVEEIRIRPAGSGPWVLERWERDGEIVFSRNRDYWGSAPRLERLRIRLLSEALTQTAEFETRNLDILEIPRMELEKWQGRPAWRERIQPLDELDTYYLGMNCSRPPYNDLSVRKAMNLALDREKILALLLSGAGTLASGPVPPQLLSGPPPQPYPFDPQEARRLLQEAGYPTGFKTQLWVAGGSEMYHVLEAFQSYLGAVGVEVELLRSDWNLFKTAVLEGKPDLYYLNWRADYPDGENFLYPLFHSAESMTKRNRYRNRAVDRLIETIQSQPPGAEREALIDSANRTIWAEAPWVFLWYSQTNYVVQPGVSGFEPRLIFNAERYTGIEKRIPASER